MLPRLPAELLHSIAEHLPDRDLLNLALCSRDLALLLLPLYKTHLLIHDRFGIPAICHAVMGNNLPPKLLRRLLAHRNLTVNTRYPGIPMSRAPAAATIIATTCCRPRRHWWWTPGATALYMAVQQRNEPMVRLLLSFGADPTIKAGGRRKHSALYEVVVPDPRGPNNLALAKLLLEKGADASECIDRRRGRKPLLHVAVLRGNVALAGLLLEYGADIAAREWVWGKGRGVAELRVRSGVMRKLLEEAWRVCRVLEGDACEVVDC